jgi:hypothetical protein
MAGAIWASSLDPPSGGLHVHYGAEATARFSYFVDIARKDRL